MSRVSDYDEATAAKICARLMDGESLRSICKDEDMPARSTVHVWLAERNEFAEKYALARDRQADTIFDEILHIADTPQLGEIVTEEGDKVTVRREDMIAHRRLQIDARKWMAGKLRPKKYGDRTILGGDEENPVRVEMNDTDLARLLVFQLTKASREAE